MRGRGLWATAWAFAFGFGLVGSSQLGCRPIVYECQSHADCRSEDSGSCEDSGYCSYADATCPSGRRYSVYAATGLAGACLDDVPDASGPAASGDDGDGSGPADSNGGSPTASASTTGSSDDSTDTLPGTTGPVDPQTTGDGSAGDGTTDADPEPGSTGSSDSGDPAGGGECIDFDAASDLGVVASGTTVDRENDWDPSCGTPGLGDFVVLWTAPNEGHYHFRVDGLGTNPVVAVIDKCNGQEIACNDDADQNTSDAMVQFDLADGQEVLLVIDGSEGEVGFELEVFTH